MTPRKKAQELVDKFSDLEDGEMYIGKAKQCALIAVDEIINEFKNKCCESANGRYWQEVKQEIEKL